MSVRSRDKGRNQKYQLGSVHTVRVQRSGAVDRPYANCMNLDPDI